MSANYNTALFRQLQAPLLDALRQIEGGLEKILSNQIQPKELGLVDKAHEVTSSLRIVQRTAVTRLSETIEAGVVALNAPERRGWDYIQVQSVARALMPLVAGFNRHLQDMAAGNDDLHVHLWPVWAKACALMEQPEPDLEDLFEIDPDFNGDTFSPRPAEYLAAVAAGAYDRLVAAIGMVEVARNRQGMEEGLRKAGEVFNQIYALRHRRAYQAYWLVVRARLAVGLMQPDKLIHQQAEWLALLREASIQLKKFGADARRVSPKLLKDVLKPLMKPWPPEWAVAHPTLAELDRRLGLSVFWQAAKDIREDTRDGALAQFSVRQREIEENVGLLKNHWNKLVGVPEEQRKAALAGFLRALVSLGPKKEWFPGTFVGPLFDGLRALGDKLADRLKAREQPPIDDRLAFEVAATILMLDEVTERRSRWSQELESRCGTQAYRLGLAVNGRYAELAGMPPLRWDPRWRERQAERAVRTALSLVSDEVGIVEKALADLSRGEDEEEIRDRFDELKGRCRRIGLVLETLRQPVPARVAHGVRDRIEGLALERSIEDSMRGLAIAIASLQRFLQSRKNGDAEALSLVEPGFDALFGPGSYALEVHRFQGSAPAVSDEEASAIPMPPAASPPMQDAVPGATPALSVDALPMRDLRAELLGEGLTDVPASPDILAIFLEEATAAIEEVAALRPALKAGGDAEETAVQWASLRRQFHTLKGSGRICGLVGLGEVAWWVEERLNEALAMKEGYGLDLDAALAVASEQLDGWYGTLRAGAPSVFVQAGDVREALDRALPFFAPSPSEEPAGPDTIAAMDDEDLAFVWPGDSSAEKALDGGQTEDDLPVEEGEALAISADLGFEEAPATAEPASSSWGDLVQEDAAKHAENLATVALAHEVGGGWDLGGVHWSAHTLASLFPDEAAGPKALAKALEAWAEAQMEGTPLSGVSDDRVSEGVQALLRLAEALAQGESLSDPDEGLAASLAEQGEAGAEDLDDWVLDLGSPEAPEPLPPVQEDQVPGPASDSLGLTLEGPGDLEEATQGDALEASLEDAVDGMAIPSREEPAISEILEDDTAVDPPLGGESDDLDAGLAPVPGEAGILDWTEGLVVEPGEDLDRLDFPSAPREDDGMEGVAAPAFATEDEGLAPGPTEEEESERGLDGFVPAPAVEEEAPGGLEPEPAVGQRLDALVFAVDDTDRPEPDLVQEEEGSDGVGSDSPLAGSERDFVDAGAAPASDEAAVSGGLEWEEETPEAQGALDETVGERVDAPAAELVGAAESEVEPEAIPSEEPPVPAPAVSEEGEAVGSDVAIAEAAAPVSPVGEAQPLDDEAEERARERDLQWEKVFAALATLQQGFAALSESLLELNERDYRDD